MPARGIEASRFEQIRSKFEAIGAELSDDQLLELADTYHDILRERRQRRHARPRPAGAPQPGAGFSL